MEFGIWLILVGAGGCAPENKTMLVTYVQGDVFLPDLKPRAWNSGEAVDCEIASRTSVPPDKRGDLLLCGTQTQLAWSQSWLRDDIRSQLYGNAAAFRVSFHSNGHGSGRMHPPVWTCQRAAEGVDCE